MLIPSKLSRPVRLQNTVIRDRLLAKLASAGNYRLTLVNARRDTGKTTLIAQWAAGKADLGWYSGWSDNQPERFASYLIAALQQASGEPKHQYASLSALFAQLFIELADWHQPLYGDRRLPPYHQRRHPRSHALFPSPSAGKPDADPALTHPAAAHASPICGCAISCWKWVRSSWRLPIRKPNSSSTAARRRRWNNRTAAACATKSKAGPPRCS